MSRAGRSLLLALALLAAGAAPTPAPAQAERVAGGAALGVAGGAVVTISAIVWRARFQREYLDSVDDLIHWQTLPMIAAPAAGVVFGLAGRDAVMGSLVGSVSGMLLGAATGAGLGWIVSATPESPWAGGVIGAGAGLTLGGLLGGLRAWSRDENAKLELPPQLRLGISIPVR